MKTPIRILTLFAFLAFGAACGGTDTDNGADGCSRYLAALGDCGFTTDDACTDEGQAACVVDQLDASCGNLFEASISCAF